MPSISALGELSPRLLQDAQLYKNRGKLHATTSVGKFCNTVTRSFAAKLFAPPVAPRGLMLRTPDEFFNGLMPHEPHYLEVPLSALFEDTPPEYMPAQCEHNALDAAAGPLATARVHYLDVSPESTYRGTVLCVHGQPTSSYLYRKMIPAFAARGYRVVCMDHLGFGRSDKFGSIADYSHAMHVSTLEYFINQLDLQDLTLVCQDWGVPTSASVLRRQPERFSRIVIMNGSVGKAKVALRSVLNFLEWRQYAKRMGPELDIQLVMGEGSPGISLEELRGYSAPFPSAAFRAGPAAWPLLAPLTPKFAAFEEMEISREFLSTWRKPCLLVFSESGTCQALAELIPGCTRPPILIDGAGHFLQEPAGRQIADQVIQFIESPVAPPTAEGGASPIDQADVKLVKS